MKRNIDLNSGNSIRKSLGDTAIVGIDPGVTTGVSVLTFDAKPKSPLPTDVPGWGSHQYSYGGSGNAKDLITVEGGFIEQRICQDVADIIGALSQCKQRVVVTIEDFVIRKQNSTRDFLSPVRITAGILQEIYELDRVAVIFQQPSDAKGTCTDERLDKWGFKIETQKDRHSRDADRHAILSLRRLLENPAKMSSLFS